VPAPSDRGGRQRAGTVSLPEAVAILGATVMSHNLYLHSSIVQTWPR
jgi:Mn2+/Fe2+ NRAMP family transporter